MSKRFERYVNVLFAFGLIFLFSACGGGGSGGGGGESSALEYTGSTTSVQIDSENAEEVTANAFEMSDLALDLGNSSSSSVTGAITIIETTPSRPRAVILAQVMLDFLEQADIVNNLTDNPAVIGAARTESNELIGTCGGNVIFTISADSQDQFTVDINYNNYCTNDIVVNGTMSMQGSVDSQENIQATSNFQNFTIALGDGTSVTMEGSMTFAFTGLETGSNFTMNMLIQDNATNKVYQIKDLTVLMYDTTNTSTTFTMAGKLYDPDYGIATLSTETPFFLNLANTMPSSGVMLVSGANDKKAKLTVVSTSYVQVTADTDGDGNYDDYDSGVILWSELGN